MCIKYEIKHKTKSMKNKVAMVVSLLNGLQNSPWADSKEINNKLMYSKVNVMHMKKRKGKKKREKS